MKEMLSNEIRYSTSKNRVTQVFVELNSLVVVETYKNRYTTATIYTDNIQDVQFNERTQTFKIELKQSIQVQNLRTPARTLELETTPHVKGQLYDMFNLLRINKIKCVWE